MPQYWIKDFYTKKHFKIDYINSVLKPHWNIAAKNGISKLSPTIKSTTFITKIDVFDFNKRTTLMNKNTPFLGKEPSKMTLMGSIESQIVKSEIAHNN